MTITSSQLIAAIKTLLEGIEGIQRVETGMPHLAIPAGLCAFVAMESLTVSEMSLSTPVELRSARVRLTRQYAATSFADIETELAAAADSVAELLYEHFTFSGQIRNVDFGSFGVTWTDDQIPNEGPWFRCADILVPAVIDSDIAMVA